MRNTHPVRFLLVVLVTVALATSCGNDDDAETEPEDASSSAPDQLDADEAALVEAFVQSSIRAAEAHDELDVSPAARAGYHDFLTCAAQAVVTVVGLDALAEDGVTVQAANDGDLDDLELTAIPSVTERSDAVRAATGACTDFVGLFQYFSEQDGLDADTAECYGRGLVEIGLDEMLLQSMFEEDLPDPSDEELDEMESVLLACMEDQ